MHNSSLSTRQFIKTSIYHTSWTHHIYTYVDNIDSIDHCALWCRIEPHYCELFYLEGTRCWYGHRDQVTYKEGPKGLSPVDVYWDPGEFGELFYIVIYTGLNANDRSASAASAPDIDELYPSVGTMAASYWTKYMHTSVDLSGMDSSLRLSACKYLVCLSVRHP